MEEEYLNGFKIIRRNNIDENMILSDFENNINININGETLSQNQITNKIYYNNENYNKNNNSNVNVVKNNSFKKIVNIPDEPKPIEPGQVDPVEFFKSSLKGLF